MRASRPPCSARERGQAVPIVLLVLVFACAVCLAVARLGSLLAQREHVRHAADAVALAGAIDGEDGARNIAAANGVTLVSFTADGDQVAVVARAGRFSALARAERVIVLAGE